MKARDFNWPLWAGLVLSVAAILSYPLVFVRWPLTRDFPWVNLALFGLAAVALLAGVSRAFKPGRFRVVRVIVSSIVVTLSGATLYSFISVAFVEARRLPASSGAPSVGQKAPDFALLDANGTRVSLAEMLAAPIQPNHFAPGAAPRPASSVLLVFYMGHGCLACNAELRGLQENLSRFINEGVRVVAISVDAPAISRDLAQKAGYTFMFLSDPDRDVIGRYDLLEQDQNTPRPAEFLVDAAGTVRWRMLTGSYYVRARPEQILKTAGALQ